MAFNETGDLANDSIAYSVFEFNPAGDLVFKVGARRAGAVARHWHQAAGSECVLRACVRARCPPQETIKP